MPRIMYSADTKAAILKAAQGKPLKEAHAAAKAVGYKGAPASLYYMLRNSKKKGSKPKKPVVATSKPAGLDQIEQLVAAEVQSRINTAIKAAIAELQKFTC